MKKPILIVIGFIIAIAGFTLYRQMNSGVESANACPFSQKTVKLLTPKGEVAAVKLEKPRLLTLSTFDTSVLQGKVTLLNLWATWCVPCKVEMPALDALNKAKGDANFEVVAINIDTRNLERAGDFLRDAKITSLKPYSDPTAKIFQELKSQGLAFGMPTSLLIGKDGCVMSSLAGPAEWNSKDAHDLIEQAKQ